MKRNEKIYMDRNWEKVRAQLDQVMPVTQPPAPSSLSRRWHIAAIAVGMSGLILIFSLRQISLQPSAPEPTAMQSGTKVAVETKAVAASNVFESATTATEKQADMQPGVQADPQSKSTRAVASKHSGIASYSYPGANKSILLNRKTKKAKSAQNLPSERPTQPIVPTNSLVQLSDATQEALLAKAGVEAGVEAMDTQPMSTIDVDLTDEALLAAQTGASASPSVISLQTADGVVHTSAVAQLPVVNELAPLVVDSKATLPILVPSSAKRVQPWFFGVQGNIGCSLLPLPSNGSVSLSARYRLKSGYACYGGLGIDQIYFGSRPAVRVAVSESAVDDAKLSVDVDQYIKSRMSNGDFPTLRGAMYASIHAGVQKHFNNRWIAGAAIKYQRFMYARLSNNEIMSTSTLGTSGFNSVLPAEVDQAYDQLVNKVYSKNSIALQVQLQYALSRRLSVGLMSQNVLTNAHPEPISVHATVTYLPFGR
jgi:hypothetical protein